MAISDHRCVCLLYTDLLPWEIVGINDLINNLGEHYSLKFILVGEEHRNYLKKIPKDQRVWIIARDGYQACKYLGASGFKGRLFLSVLGVPQSLNPITLFWKKFNTTFPVDTVWLTHSPMNFRYYRQFGGMPSHAIKYLPLPAGQSFPTLSNVRQESASESPLVVGTLAAFSSESNLAFFICVAHYVVHYLSSESKPVEFRILGRGILKDHLHQMIRALKLESQVKVVSINDPSLLSCLDVFCYVPLQNQHFLPLMFAASCRIPVVATQIVGIEDYIEDTVSGFVVGGEDISKMGAKILHFLQNPALREKMGSALNTNIERLFSPNELSAAYEQVLFSSSRGNSPQLNRQLG